MGTVFTLARFSEAFRVLRAGDLGLAIAYVPLTMVVMNAAYAEAAYTAGWLSDRIDRRRVPTRERPADVGHRFGTLIAAQ